MQGKWARTNLDDSVVRVQGRKCAGKEPMPRAAIRLLSVFVVWWQRLRISIDIYGKTYLKLSVGVTDPEALGATGAPKANGWLLRLPQTNLFHVARAVS
jgi:hypothetical protein